MGFVCPDGCYTNCTGCEGSCSGSCGGACSYNCTYGCANYCAYDCTYGCSGCRGCSSCSGTCNTACNTTCKTTVQATNIANLSLNDVMLTNDITKIKDAIKFEVVDRRGKSLSYTVTFAAGEAIDDTKITRIIANLAQAGQTASYSASAGATALKALGTDLIAKIKAANNAEVGLPL